MVKAGYSGLNATVDVAGKEEDWVFMESGIYMHRKPLSMTLKRGTPPTGPRPKAK